MQNGNIGADSTHTLGHCKHGMWELIAEEFTRKKVAPQKGVEGEAEKTIVYLMHVMLPFRWLTSKSVRFEGTRQCQRAFNEIKTLLASGQVKVHYDTEREMRLYVDEGPAGVATTIKQKYIMEGVD